MARKLSVALEADVAGFVRPVEAAKKSVDDLGDKVDKLDHKLDEAAVDAAKAGVALKLLGTEADIAGRKVGDIGDKERNLAVLDSKIRETTGEVRKLSDEFNRTGKTDVFAKLGDAQGRLAALTKVRKDIAKSIEGGVQDGVKELGNPGEWGGLQEAALQAAGIFAPALLAAAGGALTGAVGLGVAGVGIAGAILGDPKRFGFAWSQTLHELKSDFVDASKPFANETYGLIARIGPMVQSWHLDQILADAVKYVQPLAQGAEGFATGLVKGVASLVHEGGPAVNELSTDMIMLGDATGAAMSSIADGAQGGAYALHDLSVGVSDVVRAFGYITEAAEKAYEFVHDHPVMTAIATVGASIPFSLYERANSESGKLVYQQSYLKGKALEAGHAFSAQGDDLTELAKQLNATTLSSDKLAASMVDKLFTATMNLDQATLGIAESHTHLQKQLDESRKALGKHANMLDVNTERGQANEEAILASVSANQRLYQAQVAAGMSAEDAAKQYEGNTAALEDQLRKAGVAEDKIQGLVGKYKDIPKRVDTDIAINGLTQAIDHLNETLRLINGIHDKTVTLTVKQVTTSAGFPVPMGQSRGGGWHAGGIRRAAVGMVVPPSDPGTVLMGEPQTGGEALIPLMGIAPSRAAMLGQIAMGGYGYNVVPQSASGMPRELVLHATFIDPMSGDVMRRTAIRWSLDRGRDPNDFFTKA